jgi:S-formylglutathione hydrolase FrmB
MSRPFRLFLLLFAISSSAMARAQSRIDCNALNSHILQRPVRYCVLLPPKYDSAGLRYPVVYFLHGLGQNEQTLFNTGGWTLTDDLRQQHKVSDFLIVAPDGFRSFFVNSADGKSRYNDFFLSEFLPYIEHKYRIRGGRQARAITGVSMGGYGALRIAFAHPELFSSVSAQSAALMSESIQELNAAMRSGSQLGRVLAPVFGQPIDAGHWRANDPFVLARAHAAGLKKLAIYFNCGRDDDFAFEKGAEALHRQLQAEGIPHEYHLYSGDHSLQYFLAHMGETLEFHSRAFAGKVSGSNQGTASGRTVSATQIPTTRPSGVSAGPQVVPPAPQLRLFGRVTNAPRSARYTSKAHPGTKPASPPGWPRVPHSGRPTGVALRESGPYTSTRQE